MEEESDKDDDTSASQARGRGGPNMLPRSPADWFGVPPRGFAPFGGPRPGTMGSPGIRPGQVGPAGMGGLEMMMGPGGRGGLFMGRPGGISVGPLGRPNRPEGMTPVTHHPPSGANQTGKRDRQEIGGPETQQRHGEGKRRWGGSERETTLSCHCN